MKSQVKNLASDVINVRADTSELDKQIGEMRLLVADFPDVAHEVADLLFSLSDDCIEVAGVEILAAAGTSEISVRLKLSKRLVEAIAALRTGDRDLSGIL
jgi:hypothetical protein